MNEDEEKIRKRAFEMWMEEGQPEGRDKEYWQRAKAELETLGAVEVKSE